MNHLKKEDEKLYPALRDAAKTDSKLKSIIDIFAKDMDKVSVSAIDFFKKYGRGKPGVEFVNDFGHLFGTITNRITKEEMILYPEYDKISEK